METKEKRNTGLVVVIIILIVALLGSVGYIVYDKVLSKDKESNTLDKDSEIKKETTIKKNYETKDLVYTDIEFNVSFGENIKISKIPKINLKNDNINMINNNIEKYFKKIMKTEKFEDNYIYNYTPNIYIISYEYYDKGDILSLLIKYQELSEGENPYSYIIYNINKSNGNVISNTELLNNMNYSIDNIKTKLKENLANHYDFKYKEDYNVKNKDVRGNYTKDYDLLSNVYQPLEENILLNYIDDNNVYLPLFINKDGKLSTYTFVEKEGGSGRDNKIFELE